MECSDNPLRKNSLSNTFKLRRASTFHSKAPRLLEALEYQHKFSESELQMKMTSYLNNKQHIEVSLIEILTSVIESKSNKFIPKKMYDPMELSLAKIKSLPVLYYAITKNFEYMGEEAGITDWGSLYDWNERKIGVKKQQMLDQFPQFVPKVIEDIIEGETVI